MKFNFVNDPLVSCVEDGRSRIVSIRQAIERSSSIDMIGGRLYQRAAIVSFLAGLTQAAFAEAGIEIGDLSLVKKDLIKVVTEYLDRHQEQFEIFGGSFLQHPRLESHGRRDGANLVLECPVGSKTLWFSRGKRASASKREVVLGLLVSQYFRQGSLYRQEDIWTKKEIISCRPSPLTSRLVVLVEGESLLDTISYHVFPSATLGLLAVDRPHWDREFNSRKDYVDYAMGSYFGAILPVPFAYYVHEDQDGRISVSESMTDWTSSENRAKGDVEPSWLDCRHPMLVFVQGGKGKRPEVLRERWGAYRQLGAALAMVKKTQRDDFAWGFSRAEGDLGKRKIVSVGGVAWEQSKGVTSFPESSFVVSPNVHDGWVNTYLETFSYADSCWNRLEDSLSSYYRVAYGSPSIRDKRWVGFRDRASERYWTYLGNHSHVAFNTVGSDDVQWKKLCNENMTATYNETCPIGSIQESEAYIAGRRKMVEG